jgi:hypothetical protein
LFNKIFLDLASKSLVNTDDQSEFCPISSIKANQAEKPNSDELLSISNPFFPPFISSSNDFHSYLALLRSFLSISFLSFWQTFPFLQTPELIPPSSPIRHKTSTTTPPHHHHNQYTLTNNNVLIPSKPSLINFIHQPKNSNNEKTKSKNLKKYTCDICSRAFSRSNTLITHKVKQKYSSIEFLFFFF